MTPTEQGVALLKGGRFHEALQLFGAALREQPLAVDPRVGLSRACEGMGDGWAAAADPEMTLAIYMGRDEVAAITTALMTQGRNPHTPAIAIENAGRPSARAIPADLRSLSLAVAAAGPTGPVVLLIGAVAAQADLALTSSLDTGAAAVRRALDRRRVAGRPAS